VGVGDDLQAKIIAEWGALSTGDLAPSSQQLVMIRRLSHSVPKRLCQEAPELVGYHVGGIEIGGVVVKLG
jgi:hypothetical protein